MNIKPLSQKQKGFTVIEVILFVIIIGLIAGIGWYVVDSNQKTQKQLESLGESKSATPSTKSSKFVFKELGVQIVLPEALEGLSYKVEQIEGSPVLYLHSPSMDQVSEKCYGEKIPPNSDPDIGSFGAVSKINGKYTGEPDADGYVGPPSLKQFDNFYIDGNVPNGTTACTVTGVQADLAQSEVNNLFGAIRDAFKTATLVQ